MTPKERAAMQQALGALEQLGYGGSYAAIDLREALDHSGEATEMVAELAERRPQNCGTGYCSCIECPYKEQQIEQSKLTEDEISKTISNNIFKAWGAK